MDFYKKLKMASRQGKAINHMYPTLFASGIKRKKVEKPDPEPIQNISKLLQEIEEKKQEKEKANNSMTQTYTSSFRAISREQHEFSTRNKSGSPRVGLYNPRWESVKPRIDQGVSYVKKKTSSTEKYVFMPNCAVSSFSCSFPRRKSAEEANELGEYIENLKRTKTKANKYEKACEDISAHQKDPKKISLHLQSPIRLNQQRPRPEFVTEKDPPNEKRFSFPGSTSLVNSRNRKAQTYDFSKWKDRKPLFPEKLSLGPYERNEEQLMERLDLSILDFNKRPSRQDLVYTQVLETPQPLEFEVFEHAHFKQSTVRGPVKIPVISSVTPRDDLMYRVKDGYVYNVPKIQSAEANPKYLGDVPVSTLKAKFRCKTSN